MFGVVFSSSLSTMATNYKLTWLKKTLTIFEWILMVEFLVEEIQDSIVDL